MNKWTVVACDQYTSEPEYWDEVYKEVGDCPSTLKLILPELYLEEPDVAQRIDKIHAEMKKYIADGLADATLTHVYGEAAVSMQRERYTKAID
jgi:hypothetical protein